MRTFPRRRFVGFNGGVCAEGAKALGVTETDTEADNMAPANVLGVILVEAGAAIAAGAEVQADSQRPCHHQGRRCGQRYRLGCGHGRR